MRLKPISAAETARYMGIKGEPDERTAAIIGKYEPLVRERLRPSYVFKVADVELLPDGVKFGGMNAVFTGDDIKKHLSGCSRAVIFAATVSAEADKIIRQAAVEGMAEALAVDCLCSSAIEQVCDVAEDEIFSEIDAPFRTWRFSPGYGDLPITLQKDIIIFLNASRRIGLTVTESSLLLPTKSVTAIVGISENQPVRREKGCGVCNMRERCGLRKVGGCG